LREAQQRDAHLAFLEESCFQLTPIVRRMLAPRGQTPILRCWEWRDKVPVISAIRLTPLRRLLELLFQLLPGKENVHGEEVIAYLRLLRRQPRRFSLVWDRSQIQSRSRVVRAYLAGHPRVVAEDLPGCSVARQPASIVGGKLFTRAAVSIATPCGSAGVMVTC
jgi:hypothetical protein